MKIDVYKSETDTYKQMELIGQYKYIGSDDISMDLEYGKIYNCIGVYPDDDLFDGGTIDIVDNSGENYLYPLDSFIKVE